MTSNKNIQNRSSGDTADTTDIAIIGAALSGLVCARILQRHGVQVTVYERDADAATRQQGGDLDIHTKTGQRALKDAGLHEEFLKNTIPGAESLRVMDKTGHVVVDDQETGTSVGKGRPEIKREVLWRMLIDSLEPGTIRWGSKLTDVRAASAGSVAGAAGGSGRGAGSAGASGAGYDLEFDGGDTIHADLVIGADGAWSKVRTLLTPATPEYVGITLVEIRITDARTRHPEALAVVGGGSLFALSDSRYIGGHGGDQMALAVGIRVPEDWATADGVDWTDAAAGRDALLRELPDWAPSLTDLIRNCDDTIWPRPIYALPTGTRWQHRPGVTLVGDAAHLMSPFAGEGANLALIDGADLAREILRASDADAAIVAYERRMLPRGAKSAAESAKSLDMMFNDTAPKQLVKMFRTGMLIRRGLRRFSTTRAHSPSN